MGKGKKEVPLNKDERNSITQAVAILRTLEAHIGDTGGEGINPILLEEADDRKRQNKKRIRRS